MDWKPFTRLNVNFPLPIKSNMQSQYLIIAGLILANIALIAFLRFLNIKEDKENNLWMPKKKNL